MNSFIKEKAIQKKNRSNRNDDAKRCMTHFYASILISTGIVPKKYAAQQGNEKKMTGRGEKGQQAPA